MSCRAPPKPSQNVGAAQIRRWIGARAGTKERVEGRPTFEEVYEAHHGFVFRSALRLGVDDASVDDAVHDVFLVAHRRLEEFEGRSSLRTWLFAITLRIAQRYRRTRMRKERREDAYAAATPDATTDAYARSEAAQTLHRLLGALDDKKRTVFILSELEGMTAPEIAEAFDLALPTVYSRLRAARLELERAVERERKAEARRSA